MIAITGLKPRAGIGYSEFQDLQQSRMFAAGGHWAKKPEAGVAGWCQKGLKVEIPWKSLLW